MTGANGIGMVGEHDGNGFGRLSRGLDHRRRRREDDVDIHAHQLGREFRQLLNPVRPAKFNDDVLALDITVTAQARPQRLDPARAGRGGPEVEVSEPRDFCRLLRARRERPHRRAADERDELASPENEHRPSPLQSVYRALNLRRRLGKVLGADLNCSESWLGAAKPPALPKR
jgi:hypothetical protein